MAVKSKFDQSAGPPPKKKKSNKWRWIGGTVAVLFAIMFALYKPLATIHYGVCKTYIELNEPYPDQIRYLGMEDFGDSVRVYYRKTDPFGVVSVNSFECVFKVESETVTPYIKSVDVNGKYKTYMAEDPERIAKFNETVPAIIASNPDLTWPYFPLDDIKAYREFHDELQ